MRVAISSTGTGKEDKVDLRFGRCMYFQIHDTESGELQVVENKGINETYGAGIVSAQQLIDEKVDVIITGSLGPNAFDVIGNEEIKAYKCDVITVADCIDKFMKGELQELPEAGTAHKGMPGSNRLGQGQGQGSGNRNRHGFRGGK